MIRNGAILCLLVLVALPMVAQPAPPPPDAVLRQVLQLDDAQIRALADLGQARRAAVEPLMAQLGPAQQALDAALHADAPDATAVGNALLKVRDLQRQIEQAQHAYADGFLALLTDAQRAQVQQIHGVEAALHAAEALHALGL